MAVIRRAASSSKSNCGDDRIVIAVSDEGNGFDHNAVPLPIWRRIARGDPRSRVVHDPSTRRRRRIQRPGEHDLDDAAPPLSQLGGALASLGALARGDAAALAARRRTLATGGRAAAGAEAPRAPRGRDRRRRSVARAARCARPLSRNRAAVGRASRRNRAATLLAVVQGLLEADAAPLLRSRRELATRYEEIDLLYSIGELLGRAHPIGEVATIILREVTRRGRRATRGAARVRRIARTCCAAVATLGTDPGAVPEDVSIDDAGCGRGARISERPDRNRACSRTGCRAKSSRCRSVYAASGAAVARGRHARARRSRRRRCVHARRDQAHRGGRHPDRRRARERPPRVAATRDRQRLEQELRLAHDLQVRLMPTPSVLRGDADVAVRSEAGGIGRRRFLHLRPAGPRARRYHARRRGIARIVGRADRRRSAGGGRHSRQFHHAARRNADAAARLACRTNSRRPRCISRSSTAFSIPTAGRLIYANAGHPHAFRVPRIGAARSGSIRRHRRSGWSKPADSTRRMVPVALQRGPAGAVHRRLAGSRERRRRAVRRGAHPGAARAGARTRTPQELTDRVFAGHRRVRRHAADDRTLLVLRM